MKRARYRVHRMIQDLARDPAAAQRFREAPETTFDEYGLDETERSLLKEGSMPALIELGVHPNLQMKLIRVARAPSNRPGPLQPYLDRLRQET